MVPRLPGATEHSSSDSDGRSSSMLVSAVAPDFCSPSVLTLNRSPVFGTGQMMADGILTPSTSVVSAVGGISVAKPEILALVMPVSIAFLIPLFLVQRFGTSKISFAFAPVSFIWLLIRQSLFVSSDVLVADLVVSSQWASAASSTSRTLRASFALSTPRGPSFGSSGRKTMSPSPGFCWPRPVAKPWRPTVRLSRSVLPTYLRSHEELTH